MKRSSALTAVAALLACGGNVGDQGPTFSTARVVSQETENGATPMFLATPRGDRVVAWVSAPGGGSDGSLHVSVTPSGATEPVLVSPDIRIDEDILDPQHAVAALLARIAATP